MHKQLALALFITLSCPAIICQQVTQATLPEATEIYEIGQFVTIEVDTHGSAGYDWVITQLDKTKLELVSDQTMYPKPGTEMSIGGPGLRRLTYKAIAPGSTLICLELRQAWEPNGKSAQVKIWHITIVPRSTDII